MIIIIETVIRIKSGELEFNGQQKLSCAESTRVWRGERMRPSTYTIYGLHRECDLSDIIGNEDAVVTVLLKCYAVCFRKPYRQE